MTDQRTTRSRRAVLIGLLVNIALAGAKLIAGLVGHSYALVADAVESITDIFGSVVIWGGVKIGSRPADENHPYGHAKAEALAAFVVATIIFLAGVGILVKSIDEIITPHHAPAPFTLFVLLGVIVTKEILFRSVLRTAEEIASGLVAMDAWHHRSDAITSLAAFIGISIALIGGEGWEMADDIAAVLASFIIMYNAGAPDQGAGARADGRRARGAAGENAGGRGGGPRGAFHREGVGAQAGSGYWIDMHVQVDPGLSVREAHAIAHRVKDAIRADEPRVRDVLVHVEPFENAGPGAPLTP